MKTIFMPAPTDGSASKDVHEVNKPLFSGSGGPNFQQVKQANDIENCPVAALLAAMAFTPVGRSKITSMISEKTEPVRTDLSKLPKDTLTNPPSTPFLESQRVFTVTLTPGVGGIKNGAPETSNILYTNDGDRDTWTVLYLNDPSEKSIWGSIVEKALAQSLGSYQTFNETTLTTNDFWKIITGSGPDVLIISAQTAESEIVKAAKNSATAYSIAASKDDLAIHSSSKADVDNITGFHGHAMLGLQGSKIRLYDPAKAVERQLTPKEFKDTMKAIVFKK